MHGNIFAIRCYMDLYILQIEVSLDIERLLLTVDGITIHKLVNIGDNRFLDLQSLLYVGGIAMQVR